MQINILRLFVVLMGEECLPQRGTQAHVIRLQNRARVVKLFTLRTRGSSRSSGSSHATVDRFENFTDTSLNRTEAVAVRGSSGEPDNQPSAPDEHASRPSPEVLVFAGLQGCRNPSDVGLTMNGLHHNCKI